MKKLISFLVAALVLSSCGNKMTLMKRHYTKGYYLQKHAKNNGLDGASAKANKRVVPVTPTVLSLVQEKKEPVLTAAINTTTSSTGNKSAGRKHITKKSTEISAVTFAQKTVIPQFKPLNAFKDLEAQAGSGGGNVSLLILVLLAIFVPPLAVYLKNGGVNTWFWVTLILCVLAFSYFIFVFGGSLWFAAFLIAILYVFDIIK